MKNTKTTPHAVIAKSRSKRNPFLVKYIGKNSEVIATSELLSTKWNAKKNIRAMINMIPSDAIPKRINSMVVADKTGKKEKWFEMLSSGYEMTYSTSLSDEPGEEAL